MSVAQILFFVTFVGKLVGGGGDVARMFLYEFMQKTSPENLKANKMDLTKTT